MRPSFPLIAGDVAVQLPVQRTWHPAQELIQTPGGAWYTRTLPTSESLQWKLQYTGLTQGEALRLRSFHEQMRGSWHSFRFCDPLANLVAWSEDLTQPAWTHPGQLLVSTIPNPTSGIAQGTHLLCLAPGESQIKQTVACDPTLTYSMALLARSDSASSISLLIGESRTNVPLGAEWQGIRFSAVPGGSGDSVAFGFAVSMGASVDLAAVKVELGANSTEYVASAARTGLYAKARFVDDELVVTGIEPGVYSATVTVVANVEE